jgi:DNA-binding SARP family transcriptional activator
MSPRRDRALAVGRILRALPIAVTAAILWVLRPALPALHGSLVAPVTVEQLEGLLVFVGWLALLVAVLLAARWPGGARRNARHATSLANARRGRPTATRAGLTGRRGSAGALALTVVPPSEEHTETAVEAMPVASEAPAVASSSRPGVRISLLGSFSIDSPDGERRSVRSSTRQVLAYLALRPRGASRDELTEAIWPGEDPRRTRQRLWQSTSEARKLIGDAFVSRRGHYSLDRTKIAVDAGELEVLPAAANTATTPLAERQALERGLHLLRGEPLAGWDHVWADSDAARLRATQAALLERLGRARLATGDSRGALDAADQGLERDSLNEALWRLAMQAETELGLRESVGRRYERLRALLDDQLGLEPETETRSLYRDLLGQR